MKTKDYKQYHFFKHDLEQYQLLKSEVVDLTKRIKKLKDESITQDVVSASNGPPSYSKHSITISGANLSSGRKLKRLEMILSDKKAELTKKLIDLETEIQSIDDSLIRQIIRYKYIDGLKFWQVAQKIGGGNTEASVKMALNRFFKSCYDCYD